MARLKDAPKPLSEVPETTPTKAPAAPPKPPLRLEWIEAGSLTENPGNWRRHSQEQLQSLRELLDDPTVGWAGACLFNERTGRLVDGHARREMVDPKTPMPVLVGNWSEEAEAKILATCGPGTSKIGRTTSGPRWRDGMNDHPPPVPVSRRRPGEDRQGVLVTLSATLRRLSPAKSIGLFSVLLVVCKESLWQAAMLPEPCNQVFVFLELHLTHKVLKLLLCISRDIPCRCAHGFGRLVADLHVVKTPHDTDTHREIRAILLGLNKQENRTDRVHDSL